ncbi:MAG: rhodanese-like domain-containing protein [Candidatus Gracilibacteria bacterium]
MLGITHHDELKGMIDRNDEFILVDVLPPESFLKHHLPGAINLPLHDENFKIMAERMIPDKSMVVVVYSKDSECDAGAKAAEALAKMGYKNVSDYQAGLKEWTDLGYSLDR